MTNLRLSRTGPLSCIVAAAVVVAGAFPAAAADPPGTVVTFPVSGGTTTTFAVSTGPLSVTAPASAALGAAGDSGTITSQLGVVTVTDARAQLASAWTATASATAFTTGGASTAETIPTTAVTYWSGPATATSGSGATFAPGQPTSADQVPISTSPTAFALTSGVGDNSASWNPTLSVAVPAAAIAGPYTGTVTHSVA